MPERMQVRDLVPEHVGRSVTKISGRRASGKIRQIIFGSSLYGAHVTLVLDAAGGRTRDVPMLPPDAEISLRGGSDE